ncbi:MAG: helix-turn-helix transcriptional regulator [Oscillospiraceae bacterium]|nr:helix-turn-helix transcriptional regulator [Oscillospiraceae bacterium]
MICYNPFWETLKKKGVTTYALINKHNISSATIDRIKKNGGISTTKIDDFCKILNCKVEEIIAYIPDEEYCLAEKEEFRAKTEKMCPCRKNCCHQSICSLTERA